jgi:dTDP-4-amino-4,6-dideoxygalactose transaminase
MSEINAAFGLLQLKIIDEALAKRKVVDSIYRQCLDNIKGMVCPLGTDEKATNYAYFPILVQPDYPLTRDEFYQKFRDDNVNVRRYFFPLISYFSMCRGLPSSAPANLPVAKKTAEQVICLPIYTDLSSEQIDFIISLIGS